MPLLWQLVGALEYLHEQGVAHRDLKVPYYPILKLGSHFANLSVINRQPDNILLTSTNPGARIILTDFGTAKQVSLGSRMVTFVGTIEFTAPSRHPPLTNPNINY